MNISYMSTPEDNGHCLTFDTYREAIAVYEAMKDQVYYCELWDDMSGETDELTYAGQLVDA